MGSKSRPAAHRPAHPFRCITPTREAVAQRVRTLLEDESQRHEVATWASEFIVYDDPQLYPEVTDPVVWEALLRLAGADLPSTDREFLHEAVDFEVWLSDIERTD